MAKPLVNGEPCTMCDNQDDSSCEACLADVTKQETRVRVEAALEAYKKLPEYRDVRNYY